MNRSRAVTPTSTISRGVSPSNTNNNDDFFDISSNKKSKRKNDDASSKAGEGYTNKRKRKTDQGNGKASRATSVYSGRQGSVAPSETTITTSRKAKGKGAAGGGGGGGGGGRSYAGSILDGGGEDAISSKDFAEDGRGEEDEEEDEEDDEEDVVGTAVDEWNLKTPITPEQEAIAQRYQDTRIQLERLQKYMNPSQRARLDEVQSEKAGITFNHVQRLHRQRYDELLKATVAKVVAKTANVLIGEIVEKAVATQKAKGLTGPLTPDDIREAHKALQEVTIRTGGTGAKLSVNCKKKPLFGGK
ncbi:hypothetical protein QFC22_003571 [Naganishia vaughanmartiniae]|uniref:Uncharacterized protein n=1 Tax=Naganishia vaughanmartiniae TaxID=1424756 RepID=A0ACC2X4Z2_9TREE|nr:hypothetical protein QFC22_003571 [Naganishia vaughanmartiniae]